LLPVRPFIAHLGLKKGRGRGDPCRVGQIFRDKENLLCGSMDKAGYAESFRLGCATCSWQTRR
jgi:hypothetical protein